jgi:hypothetical protein
MNKWLYEFEVEDSVIKEDKSVQKTVKKFGLLYPNRRLREDGELFYAAETSRFAKAGVLPKAAWNTILSNGGGSISDKERELYGNLLIKFRDASFELQSILIKSEKERTDTEKKRTDELIGNLEDIRRQIQAFESSQIAIFENTAESKARNRTILWWVLNIAYQKEGDENYKPFFNGETFSDKLDSYDFIEESEKEDSLILSVLRRITYLTTIWFLGKAESLEDFKEYDKAFLNDADQEEALTTEEPKVEEPKVEEPKVEEPKVEEPKVEEPKVEEPKVEEPSA